MSATTQARPRFWATYTLVGLNVLVFVAMIVAGASYDDTKQVLRWGADFGPLTLGGQWWRLLTSMFLHFGPLHLAFNMWALFNVGQVAEALFGSRAFLALYLLSGIGGSLASVLAHPLGVGGGASGAIFGVVGGVIVAAVLTRRRSGNELLLGRILPSLLLFVFYNLLIGFRTEGIDNMAHLGGLGVGAALAAAVLMWPAASLGRVAAAFLIALGGAAYAVRVVRAPVLAEYAQQVPPETHVAPPPDVGAEIARLEQAVAERPDSIELYTALGSAYLQVRSFKEAVALLTRARLRWPNDVAVLTMLGTAYLDLHDFDGAIDSFGRVAQLDSSADARYNLADAYLLRGEALADSGRSAPARADFDRVLRLEKVGELAQEARHQIQSLAHHSTTHAK